MKQNTLALLAFGFGIIGAIVIVAVPGLHELLISVERTGYIGAFFSGILYGLSFTVPIAAIIFAQIPDAYNPFFIALVGGSGAALYDLIIFYLLRRTHRWHFFQVLVERLPHRNPAWPIWLRYTIGGLMIASPIPDELAAGWFGFTTIHAPTFLLFSFVANTLGILIITGLF